MDLPRVTGGGATDDEQTPNSMKKQKAYNRLSPHQTSKLEQTFRECPRPNCEQRRELGEELKLAPEQVKFWFQNKRTQAKIQSERSEYTALRSENDDLQFQNKTLKKALKNQTCSACLAPNPLVVTVESLRRENSRLHQEHVRLLKIVLEQTNVINQVLPPTLQSPHEPIQTSLQNQKGKNIIPSFGPIPTINGHVPNHTHNLDQYIPHQNVLPPTLDQNIPIINPTYQNVPSLAFNYPHQDILMQTPTINQDIQVQGLQGVDLTTTHDWNIPTLDHDIFGHDMNFGVAPLGVNTLDFEVALMKEYANSAMEELTRLLTMNEPYWFRSSIDGKLFLHHETYEKMFHKSACLKVPHARVESSKDSRIVNLSGIQLVEMFLDSSKWGALFPTIVRDVTTIQVLDDGSLGTQNETLKLMKTKLHILSPLVPPRQFVFLRYCKQLEAGLWLIADTSLDSSPYNDTPPHAWRFPSGVMIQQITDHFSQVSWVEHMAIDDTIIIDKLYRELIVLNNAYGAERWCLTLERLCERFTSASLESLPQSDVGGVISSARERRSVMMLAHHMLKVFCETLEMKDSKDFPNINPLCNEEIKISIKKIHHNMQEGIVVTAATSVWFPISPKNVFDFLKDNRNRPQWDVLCNDNPVNEIQHITNGKNLGNFTSIIRPLNHQDGDMLILQESYTHPLEYLLVYAPISLLTLNSIMKEEDHLFSPLLPSGFTISKDGRTNASMAHQEGSLVTLLFQVLTKSTSMDNLDLDSIASLNSLLASTVEKVKVALNCANLV